MAGYHETFLKGKIAQAYQVLLEHFPQVEYETALKLSKPSQAVKKALFLSPKKCHRAEGLRLFFSGEDSHKVAAVLGFVIEDVVISRVRVGKKTVTYGFDASGPFKQQLVRRFFFRANTLVKKRTSLEELVLVYAGDDPDALIMQVYDLLADAILAIEQLSTEVK